MVEDIIVYTPMYVTFLWGTILILTRYKNNRAKFFLGVFMFAAFILYLSHAVFFKTNSATYKFFDPVYIFASLSVYPLYYWYIKLLSVETSIRMYNFRMLIPAVILSVVSVVLYQKMNGEETAGYINGFLRGIDHQLPDTLFVKLQKMNYILVRVVFNVQVIAFLYYGNKLITAYNRQIANFYSNLDSKSLLWVRFFLYSLIITAIMSTVFNIIGRRIFIDSRLLLLIPSAVFSVLLFFIGQIGSMQNHTVTDLERDRTSHSVSGMRKYTNEQLIKKLTELFSIQNIYRNTELKITDVAQMLNTNRTYVSELINIEFSCSFVEFVNRYRFNEAKRLLNEFGPDKFSISEISEHAGFGSPGTFIRVFKQFEGMTPGKYRDFLYSRSAQQVETSTDTIIQSVK
jgi:AraC-like DNA-binding protein